MSLTEAEAKSLADHLEWARDEWWECYHARNRHTPERQVAWEAKSPEEKCKAYEDGITISDEDLLAGVKKTEEDVARMGAVYTELRQSMNDQATRVALELLKASR